MAGPMSANETGVRQVLEHLAGAAKIAVASGDLTPAENNRLHSLCGDLATYTEPMIMLLKNTGGTHAAEFAMECLWRLLGAAFFIGDWAALTGKTKEIFAKELAESQAEHARAGLRLKTDAAYQLRRAAILDEAGKKPLVATSKFATAIQDGVKRRLPAGVPGTSVRNLKRDIELILQEQQTADFGNLEGSRKPA
jgi:hypothetical protein